MPALFIYALYKKKLLGLLTDRYTYLGVLAFIILVPGYYVLRDHYNPGYLNAVIENELGTRFNKVIEGHKGGDKYYTDLLTNNHFKYWYLLIIPGALFGFFSSGKWLRDLTVLLVLGFGSFFLIINTAKTKTDWYDMPLYPLLAITAAIFLYGICEFLSTMKIPESFRRNPLPYAFLLLIFTFPYQAILQSVTDKPVLEGFFLENISMAQFLQDVLRSKRNIDGFAITDCAEQNLFCYRTLIERQHIPVRFVDEHDLKDVKRLVANKDETKHHIDSTYHYHMLSTYNTVVLYQLDSLKHR